MEVFWLTIKLIVGVSVIFVLCDFQARLFLLWRQSRKKQPSDSTYKPGQGGIIPGNIEIEGGEWIVDRKATIRNVDQLAKINAEQNLNE
jgi:hypothetical protein